MPGGPTHSPTTRRRGGKGRPSSLTPETIQVIERVLLNLGSYDDAAIAAGIHPRTFDRWKQQGERDALAGRKNEYVDFYHRVVDANRKIKAILTGRVLSSRDPKMALKILERRWSTEWGLKQQIDLKDVTPAKASPRQKFEARLKAMEERQAAAMETLGIDGEGQTANDPPGIARTT
jgi:transposase